MRFKPPPPDAPEIGWRVEFRPTEVKNFLLLIFLFYFQVQLTNFENAAYCCFLVLLTRLLLKNILFIIFQSNCFLSTYFSYSNLSCYGKYETSNS